MTLKGRVLSLKLAAMDQKTRLDNLIAIAQRYCDENLKQIERYKAQKEELDQEIDELVDLMRKLEGDE